MSFLSSIGSFFAHLSSDAWHYVETNIVPILKHDAQNALPALAPIAEAAVLQLATTGHVSNDKRDMAVAQVKQAAVTAGLDVSTSLLNLAVETAYAKLKANDQIQPANPTPSAGAAPVDPGVPSTPGQN